MVLTHGEKYVDSVKWAIANKTKHAGFALFAVRGIWVSYADFSPII